MCLFIIKYTVDKRKDCTSKSFYLALGLLMSTWPLGQTTPLVWRSTYQNVMNICAALCSVTLPHFRWSDALDGELEKAFPPMLNVSLHGDASFDALPNQRSSGFTSINWSNSNNPLKRPLTSSSVRDQAQCGACWAFVACEATESSVAVNTH